MRQKCEEAEHCIHARERMEECETRVGSRSSTEEDCTEELFDFLHARDHCVSSDSFGNIVGRLVIVIKFQLFSMVLYGVGLFFTSIHSGLIEV